MTVKELLHHTFAWEEAPGVPKSEGLAEVRNYLEEDNRART